MTAFLDWLNEAPIPLLGALLFAAVIAAGFVGRVLRHWSDRFFREEPGAQREGEGYIVAAVLGLLAILIGFTLSLTLDRFETRRNLVLGEANAIRAEYLRAQLLGEPHRARLSALLVEYTDNRIALANAKVAGEAEAFQAKNDRLIATFWAAIAAAFDSIQILDFSNALVEGAAHVVDIGAARGASRLTHVPTVVFGLLVFHLISTAAVFGYVILLPRHRIVAAFALALLILSLLLIIDLDSPLRGGIRESQGPMERLSVWLKKQPPQVFDRWRSGGR